MEASPATTFNALLYTVLCILFVFLAYDFLSRAISRWGRNLPPSPPGLPIIGHLHLLKPPIHRKLTQISQTIGPVFSLRFGSRLVVVVSSPFAVDECFTKNDVVLANRPRLASSKYLTYDRTTVFAAPHGEYWRNLRRLMATEVFSTNRLNGSASVRREEVKILLRGLSSKSSSDFARVELKSRFETLNLNIIMRMVAGKRYYGEGLENTDEAKELFEIISGILKFAGGTSNPGDFLPFLRWIDYKNYEKNLKSYDHKLDVVLQRLIDEHRIDKTTNSMIDHLLVLQQSDPESYSDTIIKGLILVMIIAGTDTSAVTMEWVISNLLNHPEVLRKAQEELDTQIGTDRLVEESDLPNLKYLEAIISETLRLFPTTPLLVPHMSSKQCTIAGFNIPSETILLVNAWAVHRDPSIWDDPTTFRPERFEGNEVEGHKLIPFGLGRRACPGAGLARRVMGVTLGSLIQCFEWKRVSEETVDLTEGLGISMPKLVPLEAMCKEREIMNKVFSDVAKNKF